MAWLAFRKSGLTQRNSRSFATLFEEGDSRLETGRNFEDISHLGFAQWRLTAAAESAAVLLICDSSNTSAFARIRQEFCQLARMYTCDSCNNSETKSNMQKSKECLIKMMVMLLMYLRCTCCAFSFQIGISYKCWANLTKSSFLMIIWWLKWWKLFRVTWFCHQLLLRFQPKYLTSFKFDITNKLTVVWFQNPWVYMGGCC